MDDIFLVSYNIDYYPQVRYHGSRIERGNDYFFLLEKFTIFFWSFVCSSLKQFDSRVGDKLRQ